MDDGAQDWFLKEWFHHKGIRQSALVNDLGWLKARVSKVWNGVIPYKRDTLNEIAAYLDIQPYEMLMHPDEAIALRRLRETALQIAAEEARRPFVHAPAAKAG